MKKLFLVLTLIFCALSLYGAPAKNQPAAQPQKAQPQKAQSQKEEPKPVAVKSYTFSENLIDIPLQPLAAQKIADADLMDMNPQALKAYENAVNAENQPDAMKNPANTVKAWNEVVKITQKNPFLYYATARLAEWNKTIELFNRHQDNIDKLKTLLASSILSAEQKTGLVSKHLDEFGLNFGTLEIFELTKNVQGLDKALQGNDFQAKVKEIRQQRCEKGSGKDCFDCGASAQAEKERFELFEKACGLRYQPGCDEVNKIKAAQEAEKTRLAAEEKRKAEEFATKSYNLAEDAVNIITPFVLGTVSEEDILNADPQVLKKFEDAVAKEKMKESVKTPGAMTVMWEGIAKVTEKNPFQPAAQTRATQWREAAEKMYKHETDMSALKKNLNNTSVQPAQKTELVMKHLNEYGLYFGTLEVVNNIVYHTETANNEGVKTKIKEIRKQRCELNTAADCHSFAFNHAANEEEKMVYLKKACDLGHQLACENKPAPEVLPIPEQQTAASEPEKKEPEQPKELTEEEKFKKELNDAGRRTRIAVATSALVAGVVVGGLGGLSFYGMNKAKKDRDRYLTGYYYSETQEEMDEYRQKTNDANKKRKKYLILGGVGLGVGAALIATGITFYCIEFKGEKEVKKKYNVSFGASPMDGTLEFALRW